LNFKIENDLSYPSLGPSSADIAKSDSGRERRPVNNKVIDEVGHLLAGSGSGREKEDCQL
jgi:hypothetical protein